MRKALKATRIAENQSQQSLREALLAQSRALGAAHASGQRWASLEALARAARIGPSLELRNEAAATLARPDLREVRRFPANISPTSSSVVFTSDLESYFVSEASGGFTLRGTKDQKVIAGLPNASQRAAREDARPTGRPARWFVVGPDDRESTAIWEVWLRKILPPQKLLVPAPNRTDRAATGESKLTQHFSTALNPPGVLLTARSCILRRDAVGDVRGERPGPRHNPPPNSAATGKLTC